MKDVKYYEFINPKGGYITAGHFDESEYLDYIDKGYRLKYIGIVQGKEADYLRINKKKANYNKNGIKVVN